MSTNQGERLAFRKPQAVPTEAKGRLQSLCITRSPSGSGLRVNGSSTAWVQAENLDINMQMPLFIFNSARLQVSSFHLEASIETIATVALL